MTWTWALMTSVSWAVLVNPSVTFPSSMNFFHPQSCSFLQKRCSVSEYLLRLGSRFTTAIVNCAKWLHPAGARGKNDGLGERGARKGGLRNKAQRRRAG